MALTKLLSGGVDLTDNFLFTGRLAGDIPHGIAVHDSSTSFDGSVRIQGLDSSLSSSDVTISTANNRLTPTVAGDYICGAIHSFNGNGSSAYTPTVHLRKNGSSFQNLSGIENYASSHNETSCIIGLASFNGSTDYLETAHTHNAGTTMTSNDKGRTFMFRISD